MPTNFTLPPDTRAVGTGDPANDMDAVIDALKASGATFNVLSAAFAGGADPTGVAFSDAAFQACMTAATGTGTNTPGEMIIPPGVYKLAGGLHITGPIKIRGLGPSNNYNSAVTGAVSTLPAVTLNCAASTYLFNMPSQGYLWGGLEMSGMTINFTGTGNVFDSVNFAESAFRDMTINLTQSGSQIMTCSGTSSMLNVIHERCTFVSFNATRTKPMFSIYSSVSAAISNNTFFKCKFSNAGQDNTQYMVEFGCTGAGVSWHVADNFIECWFEHPFGGVYKSLSGQDIKIDGCVVWDVMGGSPLIGNSLYYFGAYAGNSGSQGVFISACGRNLNGPDGTSTNKWDVECEATTAGVQIQGYFTMPLTVSTNYSVYFNFHNCLDALLLGNMFPQGSGVNGNSTTVITNPAKNQVWVHGGQLNITDSAAVPTATQGGGILYGAAGQPLWLDTAGKTWNLAQDDTFSAQDAGLLAWNYDPLLIGAGGYVPTAGTIQAVRVNIRRPTPVTNLVLFQQVLGSGFTAAQCFAGVFTAAGVQVGITADQSGVWNSGTAVYKTMAITSGPFTVQPPWVWVLILQNGSANWSLGRNQSAFAGSANAGLGSASARFATGAATQTAMPASFTPGTYLTTMATEVWAGLS